MIFYVSNQILYRCNFLPEDDYQYLMDTPSWLQQISLRISPEPLQTLIPQVIQEEIIHKLENHPEIQHIIADKICRVGAESAFLSNLNLIEYNLSFEQRKVIECCFLATFIRFIILQQSQRDTKDTRLLFKEKIIAEYAEFLGDEVGNDVELTWLFRFERAILLTKSFINAKRNKGLLLLTATLLEGSKQITYIPGGHASKETKRRVRLIEYICQIKPSKRVRKTISELDYPKDKRDEATTNWSRRTYQENESITENLQSLSLDEANNIQQNTLKEKQIMNIPGYTIQKPLEVHKYFKLFQGTVSAEVNASVKLKIFPVENADVCQHEVEMFLLLGKRQDYLVKMLEFSFQPVPVVVFEEILGKETRLLKDFIGASESLVIELSLQILSGLQWIHENGVILRNLRLDSILVTMTMDNQIQVRIRDLMCAIHTPCLHPSPADNEMLKQSAMFFLAPELYDPLATASSAADVWSLGMIWFILLQRNFSVKEIENIQKNGPENFDVQLNSLPPLSLFRHLISDCLKIHPSGRPTSTQLLLQQPFSPFSVRKPPTISSSTDLPNKSIDQESIKEYEAKISIFQEKVLPMKEFYLKYFQFVKALQDRNEFLAEKIFEELRKIDPYGEGKLIYSDEMIFRKEIIDLEIMINELISFYKLNPIDHSRMKSWARIRELRAVLDEIKSLSISTVT